MSIVTKTGDAGTTGLVGGERISKSSPRLHAYGTVDELNSVLGVALAETSMPAELRPVLGGMQHVLFTVGSDLATPKETITVPRVTAEHVAAIERDIAGLEPTLPALKRFILPSGNRCGALLHQARTVCRRAERWVVTLQEEEPVNVHVRVYLNRMSDYLFLAARMANRAAGAAEEEVITGA